MVTKEEILDFGQNIGVTEIGFTTVNRLVDIPSGKVLNVTVLQRILEVMPSAKSVIILAYRVWDPIFNVVAMGPIWGAEQVPRGHMGSEFYQLYSQVLDSKAWRLANYLQKEGFNSTVTRRIALKPAATIAGLGCKGKNTLIVHPAHGPFLRLSSVLTELEIDADEPYLKDLCGECVKCIEACPTKALIPYQLDIRRCLTYAAENPLSEEVADDVRALENVIIQRPTLNSFRECTICQDACPIGH